MYTILPLFLNDAPPRTINIFVVLKPVPPTLYLFIHRDNVAVVK